MPEVAEPQLPGAPNLFLSADGNWGWGGFVQEILEQGSPNLADLRFADFNSHSSLGNSGS